MPTTHLYLFSDACPSDWLTDGQDDVWHTIVNFAFVADPQLASAIEAGTGHEEVLPRDLRYLQFISQIQSGLPSGQLRKWGTGPGYREKFCQAFTGALPAFRPIISACSFQEKVLRASKAALIESYNRHIGGIEDRGIGFKEFTDDKGRLRMKHSFVNFHGFFEIQGLENQMLVLLFMAWFVADQYKFFFRDIADSGSHQLHLTVVSDKLSGDDGDFRRRSEQNLRHLIDPENDSTPLVLAHSKVSDTFSGDLFVDNLAGWLTTAMNDCNGSYAAYARDLIPTGVWAGWHLLQTSISKLDRLSATERLAIG